MAIPGGVVVVVVLRETEVRVNERAKRVVTTGQEPIGRTPSCAGKRP
jgi:hypothetical protein